MGDLLKKVVSSPSPVDKTSFQPEEFSDKNIFRPEESGEKTTFQSEMSLEKTIFHPTATSDKVASRPTAVDVSSAFKGLLLSFLAAICFSLRSLSVKYMKNMHPAQLAVYAHFAMSACSLPPFVRSGETLLVPWKSLFWLLFCGISGALSVYLNYVSFQYLPLGEATVIILSIPVCATIAGRIFLKESCGVVQSITVVITVVGMVLTTKVPKSLTENTVSLTTEYIYGLVAAFASLITGTCRIILVRKMRNLHHSLVMFYMSSFGFLGTSVLAAIFVDFSLCQCGLQQGILTLLGVLSYLGTVFVTMALYLERVGPVTTVRTAADIILCFLFQTFIFHNAPDGYSILGAVLVGISLAVMALRKWISSFPPDSVAAKRFRFLML